MTEPRPKFKIFKFLKIILSSFAITILLLFTVACLRTLSLDVNVGLQLARWEKTNNISLVIDHHQREELLANFKGNLLLQVGEVQPCAGSSRKKCGEAATDRRCISVLSPRGYPDPHCVVLRDGDQHHRAA